MGEEDVRRPVDGALFRAWGAEGAKIGGKSRMSKLTKEQRHALAKKLLPRGGRRRGRVSMALKVSTLSFLAIGLILDRHETTRAPEATEVLGPGDNPAAWHSGLLLPQSVVTALEKALRGSLIAGTSYHVALQSDEATALTRWCRAVAPITSSADAAVFRDAADTIDATE